MLCSYEGGMEPVERVVETLEEVAARRDPTEKVPLMKQPTKAQYITPLPAEAVTGSNLKQNPEGFQPK